MGEKESKLSTVTAHTKGCINKGDFNGAQELWRDFLSSVMFNDNWTNVIEYCDGCIKLLPDYYLGYYVQGIALAETGNNEQALPYLSKASVLNPMYGGIFFTKASVEMALEKYEDADRDCQIMLSLADVNHGAYKLAAEVKSALGKHKEAVKLYGKAIELKPDHSYYYIQRATDHGSNGDFDEAMQDFSTAQKLLENIDAGDPNIGHLMILYFNRSQVKQQMGDTEGAGEDMAHFEWLMKFLSPKDGLADPDPN